MLGVHRKFSECIWPSGKLPGIEIQNLISGVHLSSRIASLLTNLITLFNDLERTADNKVKRFAM